MCWRLNSRLLIGLVLAGAASAGEQAGPPLIVLRAFDVDRDMMQEAKGVGVDALLVPGLFADSPEHIRYTLDSAQAAELPVIGGFGFMKGRKEIVEAITAYGSHPALGGLCYSPLWL